MARIGLDARMIGSVPTGLGTYATELVRSLTRLDHSNTYVVIRRPDSAPPVTAAARVEDAIVAGDLDTPRNLVQGGAIARLKLDLYHSLHHFLPLSPAAPRIVMTLHDLIWLEHPELIKDGRFGAVHRTATHLFARFAMRHAVRRADHIIAISAHTRSRVRSYYGVDAQRVTVVHHGIDHQAFWPGDFVPGQRRYFLGVGNTRPYKNMANAVRAFAICAARDKDVRLLIAGRGDSVAILRPLADRLGIGRRVDFVGPLEQADLLALMHGATALVFPSLVEGFGLPVLEAMSAGCPVIGSRIPTVLEVAADAALACDPSRPDEFAAAMMRLLEDDDLRRDLVLRGCERAARFSWERCAAETLAVYQKVL
jgi:glycosyltransferase involved in cell wall biosynthesis